MKKYGYLFDKICTYENLYRAYLNARSKKGWYGEVKIIARRPFYYLAALKWMFETGNYHTSEYESFIKNDGKKERELYKLPFFPDRIAQWAIIQVLMPTYLNFFTDDSYSSIPKKGIHAVVKKLRKALDSYPEEMQYCLELDAKKFYLSIPPFVRGVDFVGYRFFKDFTLLRKSTCIDMKRKMVKILNKVTSGKMMSYHDYCSINSYNGWLKHCDSIRLKRKYIEPLIPYCEIFYIECIKGGGINNENVSEYKKCG